MQEIAYMNIPNSNYSILNIELPYKAYIIRTIKVLNSHNKVYNESCALTFFLRCA